MKTTSVAFSLNRALGPAVTRNRLRRRLRAILREMPVALPPGMLLIGANRRATELTFDQLRTEVQQLTAKAITSRTITSPPAEAPAASS